jgi:anaerobic selenocysteine-containing dehydrogenase
MEIIDDADDDHPIRLVTAPARQYLNTSFTETPTSIMKEERPTVLVHPEDANALGIKPGDLVRLGNKLGSVLLHAEFADGQQQGVAIVESIWPNHAFIEGIGINVLTSADPGPPNGGAVFHDTAIWIQREPSQADDQQQKQDSEPVPA